jgi:hypothetical protein
MTVTNFRVTNFRVTNFSSNFIALVLAVAAVAASALAGGPAPAPAQQDQPRAFPEPRIPFAPPHYMCYRTAAPPVIDGKLDEAAWKSAAWTEGFVDIEGSLKPRPRFRTRAKMLWDESYLYIGAGLEEPDVWATLTKRDSIIFQDNDFEVFIDPTGDTHQYYELEINALNTVWDLFLVKPYRDTGPAVHAWDIQGLKTGVFVEGTLNKPGDKDRGWTVEIALPWDVLEEAVPGKKLPSRGDQWRMDFSRVEYRVNVKDGAYAKVISPESGKPLPEDNWVWAPTGLINIHYPEMWGYVQFSDNVAGAGTDTFVSRPEEAAKWVLRQVYYKEKTYYLNHGAYTDDPAKLGLAGMNVKGYKWPPLIKVTWNLWEAVLESQDGTQKISITSDGRVSASH